MEQLADPSLAPESKNRKALLFVLVSMLVGVLSGNIAVSFLGSNPESAMKFAESSGSVLAPGIAAATGLLGWFWNIAVFAITALATGFVTAIAGLIYLGARKS